MAPHGRADRANVARTRLGSAPLLRGGAAVAATSLDFQAISGVDSTLQPGVEAFVRDALALSGGEGGEPQALELVALWRDLVNGRWFVRSGFCSETECFLVLEPRAKPPGSRPPPAHV